MCVGSAVAVGKNRVERDWINKMADIRLDVKGKRPHFFDSPELDTFMTALLEVMSENWALRENLVALEDILKDKGVLDADGIENYELPVALKEKLKTQQQDFLHDAFRSLGASYESVGSRQKFIDAEEYKRDIEQ